MMSKKMNTKTSARDCKPTILAPDTLMAWDWTFVDKENYEKYCIEKRCCENVQQCLAIASKLKTKDIKGAEELITILY